MSLFRVGKMGFWYVLVSWMLVTCLVSCYAASGKYELVVTVYDSPDCAGVKYGTWSYTSNSTCFTVYQPPVPTMYVDISSLSGEIYGSICSNCSSGAVCTGKYKEDVCYNVDSIIHSTDYPFGVQFEYYRIPTKNKTSCEECMVHCQESYKVNNAQVDVQLSISDEVTVTTV